MGAVRETVTIIRKAKVDKLKPASGPTAEIDVKRCVVLPRASNENGGGWVQESGWTIYAPVGSDFRPDDMVRVRGLTYAVEGVPGVFPVKRGLGVAVTTERVGATNG